MPTTSNFGWNTPADTDLVKDGALAIRTLGNNIDASMAELKGGTTGQVLSKTSNTDMDFTWVTSDDANAIQNAIVDAKGDLIAATANDTPARLAVGSNGDTLVADSAATTGLRWSGTPSASNPIINSSFDVWQRGTSFSIGANGAGQYTADRWYSRNTGSAVTISRQATGDTTNLPNIQYCVRWQRDAGQTSTAPNYFTQSFETSNSIPFAGKTVTYSFYARKGANFSGNIAAQLFSGTGTDQNLIAGYTGSNALISQNIAGTLTTTWQRFTFTATVPTTATELACHFEWNPSGTAGAADLFEATGFQIDIGSVALPFRRAGGTLQGELAACQRYYWRSTGDTISNPYAVGITDTTTSGAFVLFNPVPMRVAPTSIGGSTLAISDYANYTNNITTLTLSSANKIASRVNGTGGSGYTSNRTAFLIGNGAGNYVEVSAEL